MLELDLQLATDAPAPSEEQFRQWCTLALRQRSADSELTIRLVDEPEGRDLNHTWRQKDYATNVLSFPQVQDDLLVGLANSDDGEILLGDIVLARETCVREAEEKGISIVDHATHLIVHGALHLVGYDHMDDASAGAMEALEVKALASLGLANPYADEI